MHGRYITDPAALAELLAQLREVAWFALDTEFEREKTYYARLCLVQVATPDLIACIDPGALPSLEPLGDILVDPAILKVLHACAQDCEILYQLLGRVPAPLFDTQVAAPLLGHPDQVGYATLVERCLGVSLAKAQTRTDWCARPLSDAQLRYAEDDVRYLAQIYPSMRAALVERGRLDWLAGDFAALAAPATYDSPPQEAWRRLRGLHRLAPAAAGAAVALAAWREATAQRLDRPRNWILRDEVLLEVARRAPADTRALGSVSGVPPRFADRHGAAVLEAIAAPSAPPTLPDDGRPAPLTPGESARLEALQAEVAAIAGRHELDASVLVSRRRLVRLLRGEPAASVFSGWRRALLAAPLSAVLDRIDDTPAPDLDRAR